MTVTPAFEINKNVNVTVDGTVSKFTIDTIQIRITGIAETAKTTITYAGTIHEDGMIFRKNKDPELVKGGLQRPGFFSEKELLEWN